jgi:uncharacterized ubiquitin-like protein YukD
MSNWTCFVALIVILCVTLSWASSPVQIAVSVRGKKYDLAAETVNEVLEKVKDMASLEDDQQHVCLFRGKVLANEDKLEDIGISAGDVLNIVKKRIQRNVASTDDVVGSKRFDPNAFKAPENEELQKAMQQLDTLLDSDIVEEYFGDDEKLEKSRIQMLENIDQYEKMMPGFRAQAEEIASDPAKWKEAMNAAKEQIIMLKQKREAMRNSTGKQKNPR